MINYELRFGWHWLLIDALADTEEDLRLSILSNCLSSSSLNVNEGLNHEGYEFVTTVP